MSTATSVVEIPSVELSDGNKIPILGFGTSNILSNDTEDEGFKAIVKAITCGYRFLDTAALYMNEEAVGSAVEYCINKGIVRREDLYICTKVWCNAHKRESVMKACKDSLKRLKMDYVDLYLIHWPMAYAEGKQDSLNPVDPDTGKLLYSDTHYTETWRGMEDVKEAKLARSIGVSNFNHLMTDDILSTCKHRPVVNQVECHAYLSQEKLAAYSEREKILLNAYCPLGSPGSCAKPGQPAVLEAPLVKELAEKYHRSTAQILLRYLIQRKIYPLPKSVNPKRIEENARVFDFELSDEDMKRMLAINQNLRYCLTAADFDPSDHPLYPFHIEY